MTKYSKFNIIYWLQKWMDSVPGQTFLNYAYSWGASIVILGTLFKLTHIEGANLMLFIGMGTEVFVFFISAFDRPFDKTADGMDLKTHYEVEGQAVQQGVVLAPGEEGEMPLDENGENTLKVYGGIDKKTKKVILEYANEKVYPGKRILVNELTVQGVAKNVIKTL